MRVAPGLTPSPAQGPPGDGARTGTAGSAESLTDRRGRPTGVGMEPAALAPPRRTPARPVRRLASAVVAALLAALLVPAAAGATTGDPVTGGGAVPGGGAAHGAQAPAAFYTGPATSANARFVVAGYQKLIGRDPDTAGLDFHLGQMAGGGERSRLGFTYGLLFSIEGSRKEVKRVYDGILHRTPDAAGEDYWTAHLQGHGVADLEVLLYASDEYANRAGGSDDAWLRQLYQDALGRPADQAGLDYWLQRRQAGVIRVLVAAGIHHSDEAMARRAARYYQDILGRTPSTAEIAGTAGTLRRVDDRVVRARMFASDEAFAPYLKAAWP